MLLTILVHYLNLYRRIPSHMGAYFSSTNVFHALSSWLKKVKLLETSTRHEGLNSSSITPPHVRLCVTDASLHDPSDKMSHNP